MERTAFCAFGLMMAAAVHAAGDCDPVPAMFCVSQRVVSHWRDGRMETTDQMFVYRFHDGSKVEIAYGNPPVTNVETLLCVENRTYKGLMVYAFSDDWRQGVAALVDPGMSTVEFLNCAPGD